ncbi:hypothetical protein [Bradyrhizobium archetypum]|uniref:Uncharacterized protein n=1 Tax=Bradyrhizobium archetypum TaxID=2721160 RepID=A0A7Y4M0R7_9BRAD|nr:hypothetical protein [Bradyrhizobium archetypum]NOJ45992.1 hypothetical protein [Bradyrhizobium archetypum]
MSNLRTIRQTTTIRPDGGAQLAAHGVLIQPDRHTFANFDELNAYLHQVLGAKLDGRGIRGTMSRRGTYSRQAADGTPAVTFGDPVLDAISSANGVLVVGDQTIDLKEAGGIRNASGSASDTVVFSRPNLKFTGIVNDAERWATDDGSMVEYRLGVGKLIFHAWKKHTLYGYWSMGGEISVLYTPAKFQAADILTNDFMSITAPCQAYPGHDDDINDTYLDQYSFGWNAQQPERTAALCKAKWHNMKFADLVTAGEGCMNYLDERYWTPGFPVNWDPVNTFLNLNGDWSDGSSRSAAISVEFPSSLKVDMSSFDRPTARGSIDNSDTITVKFPDDRTYTGHLEAPNKIRWSNGSVWVKVVNTVMDLNGNWTDGSARSAVIWEGSKSIKIDMSDFDRHEASGSIVDATNIKITFPDDRTYTAQLLSPNKIKWSNGSVWTKKPD